MENQSQTTSTRRQRGSRSGGRSRNRQANSNQGQNGNPTGGSRNRSRNRNRRGSRPAKAPQQTAFQKVLSVLTFGLLGKPAAKKPAAKRNSSPQRSAAASPRPAETSAKQEGSRSKRNRAEVTSGRLYVGNLDYSTGEPELESLFRGVGNVLSAEVVTNPRTQQSKGFAFVEMGSIEEARRAVSVLDDQEFMGRRLIVSGARAESAEGEDASN